MQLSDYVDIPTCLLILSEILPFIKYIKGNGIIDILKNFIVKSSTTGLQANVPSPEAPVDLKVPVVLELKLQTGEGNVGKLSIDWGEN